MGFAHFSLHLQMLSTQWCFAISHVKNIPKSSKEWPIYGKCNIFNGQIIYVLWTQSFNSVYIRPESIDLLLCIYVKIWIWKPCISPHSLNLHFPCMNFRIKSNWNMFFPSFFLLSSLKSLELWSLNVNPQIFLYLRIR